MKRVFIHCSHGGLIKHFKHNRAVGAQAVIVTDRIRNGNGAGFSRSGDKVNAPVCKYECSSQAVLTALKTQLRKSPSGSLSFFNTPYGGESSGVEKLP
jgi:hypothetical protein